MYPQGHPFRRSVGWRSWGSLRFRITPLPQQQTSVKPQQALRLPDIFLVALEVQSQGKSPVALCAGSPGWALQKSLLLDHPFPSWATSSLCPGPSLTPFSMYLSRACPDQECLRMGPSGLESHLLESSQWDDSYRSCLLEHAQDSCLPVGSRVDRGNESAPCQFPAPGLHVGQAMAAASAHMGKKLAGHGEKSGASPFS